MVNKVILIGNVGADPDVRYLEGGTAVANLRLATTERYKNKNGENIDQTEWHNIVLWRGLAEIVENMYTKECVCISKDASGPEAGTTRTATNVIRQKYGPIICKCYPINRKETTPEQFPGRSTRLPTRNLQLLQQLHWPRNDSDDLPFKTETCRL